jgi:tyrosine-protein phosphatase SIW14
MMQKKRDKVKRKRLRYLVLLAVIFIAGSSVYVVGEYGLPFGSYLSNNTRQAATVAEQHKWAQRIEQPGLPNFYKISDELYRGAQPTAEGMRQLEKLGVKTVVNLRALHSDRAEIKGTDLSYVHIGMTAWCISENDVIRFLRVVTDPNRMPVFVHCEHGADRTGAMCASYRVIVQGWSKEEAVKEMTKGGFGFHIFWQNLPRFIRKLNVQKIRNETGLNQ